MFLTENMIIVFGFLYYYILWHILSIKKKKKNILKILNPKTLFREYAHNFLDNIIIYYDCCNAVAISQSMHWKEFFQSNMIFLVLVFFYLRL